MKNNNWIGLCVFFGVATFGASGLSYSAEIVGLGNKCLDVSGGENANGTNVQVTLAQGVTASVTYSAVPALVYMGN